MGPGGRNTQHGEAPQNRVMDSGTAASRSPCEDALRLVDGTDDRLERSNATHVLAVAAQMGGDLAMAAAFAAM